MNVERRKTKPKNPKADQELCAAAQSGDANLLGGALAAGADIEAKDQWSRAAAMYGSQGGHESCLRALIEDGADIHAKDREDITAAMLAARNGHEECLRTLIVARADIDAKSGTGRTAATLAAQEGHPELASLIEALALARWERSEMGAAIDPPTPHPPFRPKIRV